MAMVVAAIVVVTACAPVGSKSEHHGASRYRTAVEPMQSDPDRMAGYCDRLLPLNANELAGELELTRQSFEKGRSELNRPQLALRLILSLPSASFRDDNAAIALLHPFMNGKDREGSTLRPLATMPKSKLVGLRRTDKALQQHSA